MLGQFWAGLIRCFWSPRAYTCAKRRTIGRLFVGPPGAHFGGKQRQKRYVCSVFGDVVFSVGWSQPPVSNQTFDREPCFMTKNPHPKKHLNREKRPKRYVYSAFGDFGAVLRRGFKRHPLHDYCVFFSFWPGILHRESPIRRGGSGSR